MDDITLQRKRISYARVLVEIDTSMRPIEMFEVKLHSVVIYNQYVHYENLPKFCNHCYMFGHLRENCRHLNVTYNTHKVQVEKMTPSVEVDGLDLEDTSEQNLGQQLVQDDPRSIPNGTIPEVPGSNPLEFTNSKTTAGDISENLGLNSGKSNTMEPAGTNGLEIRTHSGSQPQAQVDTLIALDDTQSSSVSKEDEEEGYQSVTRRRNKGKSTAPHQTVCSLPNVINTRQSFRAGLSKFAPVRNISKDILDKDKLINKGNGGVHLNSSTSEQ